MGANNIAFLLFQQVYCLRHVDKILISFELLYFHDVNQTMESSWLLPLLSHALIRCLTYLRVAVAIVGLETKAVDLPENHTEGPDVRLSGELAVQDRFWKGEVIEEEAHNN